MSGINTVTVVGRAGRDPEVRYTQSGTACANFIVGTSERWKGRDGGTEEKTTRHRVSMFGKVAEIAGEYVRKGDLVGVTGKLEARKWTDKNGIERETVEIIGRDLHLLTPKGSSEKQESSKKESSKPARAQREPDLADEDEDFDDDIPF